MSQPLPKKGFRFLIPDEVLTFRLQDKKEDDSLGYILEVDLQYSKELHDLHNDYLLAPKHFSIPAKILSSYAKVLLS